MRFGHAVAAAALLFVACGCTTVSSAPAPASLPVSLALESPAQGSAQLRFTAANPVTALHFVPDVGGYRPDDWRLVDAAFRWSAEAGGDRLERIDGQPFSAVSLTLEQRYRALPKSYAPFSPFSDGGLLVYSGQFHACTQLPCSGEGPLAMRISAPGRTIRAGTAAATDTLAYDSDGEGVNIYIGSRAPDTANGMSAIIDPGLPDNLRVQLARSLPAAMGYFAARYGTLSFRPQLFVSIDERGRGDGHESTQGGTLPGQIFMHFDGAKARERLAQDNPAWLDWFFAHEVAHMVQRDRTGDRLGDDVNAWMHEGGADALAAQALRAQGMAAYVDKRVTESTEGCRAGLARGPLTTATARGDFDTHYACGLIAARVVDRDLRLRGQSLDDFNRRWFADITGGATAGPESWFAAARASGLSAKTLALLRDLTGAASAPAIAALDRVAAPAPTVPQK